MSLTSLTNDNSVKNQLMRQYHRRFKMHRNDLNSSSFQRISDSNVLSFINS